MAEQHRPDHRPLHPGRILTTYRFAIIDNGPWPGRLAFGPLPSGDEAPAAIAGWGADIVLGLTTPAELDGLGVSDLSERFAAIGIPWINAPIEDFSIPDSALEAVWPALRDTLVERLQSGGKVMVHCRGGRGRSGMIATALLIAGGMAADTAVAAIRSAEPKAIETAEQHGWVLGLSRRTQPATLEGVSASLRDDAVDGAGTSERSEN